MNPSSHPSPEPRRKRVALLLNFISSAYQMSMRQAVERATRRAGVNLIVAIGRELDHSDPNERALNRIYDWLGAQSVDGVILLSGSIANYSGSEGILALCRRLAPIPVVSVGMFVPEVRSIVLDNRTAMRSAVDHLVTRHHVKRIAYIGGPDHNQEARDRLLGYCDVLREHGLVEDEGLIERGHFTLPTGRECMRRLLERGSQFEAVVAANDYMALGAIDELRERYIRVPEDVLVTGFDNAPIARFAARSLTSVAQPIEQMASVAVEDLLRLIEHDSLPRSEPLAVSLILRDSCGCGYVIKDSVGPDSAELSPASHFLDAHKGPLLRRLAQMSGAPQELCAAYAPGLIEALVAELDGKRGVFLSSVEHAAESALAREASLDDLARLLVQLRRECRNAGYHGAEHIDLEELSMKGMMMLATAGARAEGRRALDLVDRAYSLSNANQQLSMALEPAGLADNLQRSLASMGVPSAFFALCPPDDSLMLVPLMGMSWGRDAKTPAGAYPARRLFPEGFPNDDEPWCLLALPLTFEREVLGLVALDGSCDAFVTETLRSQLCASLKLGNLHAALLKETALRERLAHQQLLGEMDIAKRIQTALAPEDVRVVGLDIAASTRPADDVGGDYHDILPLADGCWLGIGDVTGHGLLSGLIMLMIQSAVSSLVAVMPDKAPAELVCSLNRILWPNIRGRLKASEHATFLLLRYFDGGRVVFAGAHEDAIVYRAKAQRCELIASTGVWLGILDDVEEQTTDVEFRLEPGDTLVLYTDGMTEARNSSGQQFGVDRVCNTIERSATQSAREVHATLLRELHAWSPLPQDDVTCVVVRRL
jgi:phosphoserine phosphatase RsbU/P